MKFIKWIVFFTGVILFTHSPAMSGNDLFHPCKHLRLQWVQQSDVGPLALNNKIVYGINDRSATYTKYKIVFLEPNGDVISTTEIPSQYATGLANGGIVLENKLLFSSYVGELYLLDEEGNLLQEAKLPQAATAMPLAWEKDKMLLPCWDGNIYILNSDLTVSKKWNLAADDEYLALSETPLLLENKLLAVPLDQNVDGLALVNESGKVVKRFEYLGDTVRTPLYRAGEVVIPGVIPQVEGLLKINLEKLTLEKSSFQCKTGEGVYAILDDGQVICRGVNQFGQPTLIVRSGKNEIVRPFAARTFFSDAVLADDYVVFGTSLEYEPSELHVMRRNGEVVAEVKGSNDKIDGISILDDGLILVKSHFNLSAYRCE